MVSILEEDGGFGVSVGDALAVCIYCAGDDLLGGSFMSGSKVALARPLRDLPVLAPWAAEVASRCGNGIS